MKTNKTKLKSIDITNLIPADWNYKQPAEEDEYKERFKRSVEEDQSLGVIAVREVDEHTFEVIDGNHRLQAALELNWTHVPCENFGKISKSMAVLIARRRNYNWFPDDTIKLAELIREASYDIPISEMAEFMPDTQEDLENMVKLLDFDWTQFDRQDGDETEDNLKKIELKVCEETYNIWMKLKERLKEKLDYKEPEKCFEFAVIQALNLPEEKYQ
jgi:hypothetical protein